MLWVPSARWQYFTVFTSNAFGAEGQTGHTAWNTSEDGTQKRLIPSPCCSGRATTEHFSPNLQARGVRFANEFEVQGTRLANMIGGPPVSWQWHLVRSEVENEVDPVSGKPGLLRDRKYWAKVDEQLCSAGQQKSCRAT